MVNVEVSKPWIINEQADLLWPGASFARMHKLDDGRIFISYGIGQDGTLGSDGLYSREEMEAQYEFITALPQRRMTCLEQREEMKKRLVKRRSWSSLATMYLSLVSTDGGKTFEQAGLPPLANLERLPDGSLFGLGGYSLVDSKEQCVFHGWRSDDDGLTWDGPILVPVQLPPMQQDADSRFMLARVVAMQNFVAIRDGSILMGAWTHKFGPDGDLARSIVLRSDDQMQSFHFYSTVACEYNLPTPAGLNEISIVRAGDGSLLAVIRTYSHAPLYQTRSSNDGATWDTLRPFGANGIYPHLIRLQNGIVCCVYGRPGINIAFSTEEGRYWQKHTQLYFDPIREDEIDVLDKTGRLRNVNFWCRERSCCNSAAVAVDENKVLVVYSAPKDASDRSIHCAWEPDQQKDFRLWAIEVTVRP